MPPFELQPVSSINQSPRRRMAARIALGLFVVQTLFVSCRLMFMQDTRGPWPEALLISLAVVSTFLSSSQQLPAQSVLLAMTSIAVLSGGVLILNAGLHIPFGAVWFMDKFGYLLFGVVPWPWPILWLVILLNAREIARLILRPWRGNHWYGFLVIGLTTALVVLVSLGLEPFATKVKDYWLRTPDESNLDWYGTPWSCFVGWAATALGILFFVTTLLINKRPVPAKPNCDSLVIWTTINFLFGSGAAGHHLWLAAGVCLGQTIAVLILVLNKAKPEPVETG